jgi:hypothetical protein
MGCRVGRHRMCRHARWLAYKGLVQGLAAWLQASSCLAGRCHTPWWSPETATSRYEHSRPSPDCCSLPHDTLYLKYAWLRCGSSLLPPLQELSHAAA